MDKSKVSYQKLFPFVLALIFWLFLLRVAVGALRDSFFPLIYINLNLILLFELYLITRSHQKPKFGISKTRICFSELFPRCSPYYSNSWWVGGVQLPRGVPRGTPRAVRVAMGEEGRRNGRIFLPLLSYCVKVATDSKLKGRSPGFVPCDTTLFVAGGSSVKQS